METIEKDKAMDTKTLVASAALVIGLFVVGTQQTQKNQANDVGNLPATNANVERNADDIKSNEESTRAEIDKLRQQLTEQMNDNVSLIRAEINRREPEIVTYIDTQIKHNQATIISVEKQVVRLDSRIFEHINTPESTHAKQ